MNHQAYIEAIYKTGFVLEDRVAQLLKSAGWTVISNKYYEDDHSSTVREVDLIAYKVSHIQHFDVYTTLIVSCKKNEENVWALLARDINLKDPNADWWPMHAWSNDPALQFRLIEPTSAKSYHDAAHSFGVLEALVVPEVEVFAFQELSRASSTTPNGKKEKAGSTSRRLASSPKNDTAIFTSITSLMKAQAYELGALPNRKKRPAIYQFNLLTVADTELLRMHFRGGKIDCVPVNSEHYIGRYIIHRKETFSRIRFIRATAFEKSLADYGSLHDLNCNWFADQCDAFYRDIAKDYRRTNVLLSAFLEEIGTFIKWRALIDFNIKLDLSSANISYEEAPRKLFINIDADLDDVEALNNSKDIFERVKYALKKIYRYAGEFEFSIDIPF
jgi:Holliday junction resolvase-like predicted endonuclease